MIGDCFLSERCDGAHVTAYARPDRMLAVLINDAAAREVTLHADLRHWLGDAGRSWQVSMWDMDGKRIAQTKLEKPQTSLQTPPMQSGEMLLIEIEPAAAPAD